MALSTEKQINIVKMLGMGYKNSEIAKAVGCSAETVRTYRKKNEELLKDPKALAKVKKDTRDINNHLELRAIEAINRRETINPLDVARDSWDLAEIGTGTGLVIAGITDDITASFNRDIPYIKRLARGMRGAQAAISLAAGLYEGLSQLKEGRSKIKAGIKREEEEEAE